MILQVYINNEIEKLCPIHGISFGILEDKTTWRIDFKDEATEEQKIAAQNFIDNFVYDENFQKYLDDQTKIEKYKNDLSVKAGYNIYKMNNPNATFLDYINFLESESV